MKDYSSLVVQELERDLWILCFQPFKESSNTCYERLAVKVAVLTGVAAQPVGDSTLHIRRTLHSMFKLPVQRGGRITNMPFLTGNYLRIVR